MAGELAIDVHHPAGQLEIRRLIRELASGGRTILLSSHDIGGAEELCGQNGEVFRRDVRGAAFGGPLDDLGLFRGG